MTYCKCHIYIRGRHKWKKQSITYINGGGGFRAAAKYGLRFLLF